MKIYLHYHNASHRGPGMVVTNLLLGLEKIGVEIVKPNQADFVGCLQLPRGHEAFWLKSNTLMGPNLFVVPPEEAWVCDKFSNFVVPSDWVKNLYLTFSQMKNKNIEVWPVGINTEFWKEKDKNPSLKNRCFVYYKNRSAQELDLVESSLKNLGYQYSVISYGNYQENELMDLCNDSEFAILLTGTESQGIAYMNILSTNTPCLVFNKDTWAYEQNHFISCEATSVPYFSNKCGKITKLPNNMEQCTDSIRTFSLGVFEDIYTPRDYIVSNYTLELSAKKYVDIISKV